MQDFAKLDPISGADRRAAHRAKGNRQRVRDQPRLLKAVQDLGNRQLPAEVRIVDAVQTGLSPRGNGAASADHCDPGERGCHVPLPFVWIENSEGVASLSSSRGAEIRRHVFTIYNTLRVPTTFEEQPVKRPERRIPNCTRHRSRRLAPTTLLRDTAWRSAISNLPRHQSIAQRKVVDCIQFEQLILPDLCKMKSNLIAAAAAQQPRAGDHLNRK